MRSLLANGWGAGAPIRKVLPIRLMCPMKIMGYADHKNHFRLANDDLFIASVLEKNRADWI